MQKISEPLRAKGKTQQNILEREIIDKKTYLHALLFKSNFSLISFALVGADREVKGLSCNEGAAPQSVIINHQGCQAAPTTHLYEPE